MIATTGVFEFSHELKLCFRPSGQAAKTDKVVAGYYAELKTARSMVNRFLEKNGFQLNKANQKRGRWFTATYPLHVAVKQQDVYICSKLLMFGADLEVKDIWGRTAFDYVRNDNRQMIEVFERHSKFMVLRNSGRATLLNSPPPRGFEEFFADLEQDPLVQVPSCESQWLLLLGPKHLRVWSLSTEAKLFRLGPNPSICLELHSRSCSSMFALS